ncbi:serine/threonine-protein kinase [Nocardia sp. GTS18]|uniref:serine/threonine-protein kinase n=1 Tax=Nocardia sp. GTS18 TaxID=1778064 RepID=UPI0015EF7A06
MSIAEGAEFAGYLIERKLGSGGMGTVYLARHPRLPRHDAIKILADDHAEDAEYRARFLREAEFAAGLQHPNLVAVRDRGETDGKLWIATQYVAGSDAADLIRRAPGGLDPARAVHIIGETARGLDEVHRAGLLHRDVKPANILVAEEAGLPDRVLITDFGIARHAEDTATLSAGGGFTATLSYVAPEQLGGDHVDRRADVYALGCSLFQLLTGTVPFPRQTPAAVMYAHLHELPPRPSALRRELPAGFDAVIARALAKDPAQRFDSCGALAAAAREAMNGSVPAQSAPQVLSPAAPASAAVPNSVHPSTPSPQYMAGVAAAVPDPRARFVHEDPFTAVLLPRRTPFARLVRRRGFLIAAAAVLMVGVVTAAMLGTGGGTESPSAQATTSPPPLPPATAWGAYSFIADLFPDLLPAFQLGVGYQELTACYMINDNGDHVPTDTLAPFARMRCEGNRDPAVSVTIECKTDRSLMSPPPSTDTVEGSEQWRRASGTGNLHWGRNTDVDGNLLGNLSIYFDDPARSFCRIRVVGGANGAELRERWWADAPL